MAEFAFYTVVCTAVWIAHGRPMRAAGLSRRAFLAAAGGQVPAHAAPDEPDRCEFPERHVRADGLADAGARVIELAVGGRRRETPATCHENLPRFCLWCPPSFDSSPSPSRRLRHLPPSAAHAGIRGHHARPGKSQAPCGVRGPDQGRAGRFALPGDSIADGWPKTGEYTWLKFAPYDPAHFGISGENDRAGSLAHHQWRAGGHRPEGRRHHDRHE